ncbi:MAG: HD domain-containing protein [Anaerolineales bacterium]|nr:HD domain-containing protein [Anaerolineales bacterium]
MDEINKVLHAQIPADQLSALLKVSNALSSSLEPAEVLQTAIRSVIELLEIETGAIYTLEGEQLYLGATSPPLPEDFPDELRLANLNAHPHLKAAIQQKKHTYLRDAKRETLTPEEQIVVDSRSLVSVLYFPLLLKKQAIGAFIVGTTSQVREFNSSEIDLCNILSSQAAFAIANAKLYTETQQALLALSRAYEETLQGWSQMIDLRDQITDEHTRRVVDLTVHLARRMNFPENEIAHIRRGALLHDIGKIGIPDAILQKPDKLTENEWVVMRTHPEIAYQVLSQIEYLKPALDIPYCHHEKWNGIGYPRKLKGEEIPLSARIFAVVDVFDALTSDRPYRKAWSKEKALNYLKDQSGKHFYPDAVEAFLEMLQDLNILK